MRGSDPCHEKNSMKIGLKLFPFLSLEVVSLEYVVCGLQDMMKLGMTVGGGKFDYIKFKIKCLFCSNRVPTIKWKLWKYVRF